MLPDGPHPAPEDLSEYRATVRRRDALERRALAQRRKRAWQLARQVARLLRERFGATRVVVFGSLIHESSFNPWSDVDIAAWGLAPEDAFRAMGAVMDLDAEVQINLVDMGPAVLPSGPSSSEKASKCDPDSERHSPVA